MHIYIERERAGDVYSIYIHICLDYVFLNFVVYPFHLPIHRGSGYILFWQATHGQLLLQLPGQTNHNSSQNR